MSKKMKSIRTINLILILHLIPLSIFSNWQEIESPLVNTGANRITNSEGMNAIYSFHNLYFSFDSWNTINISNVSHIDSMGIIIKCKHYDGNIYILVDDSPYYKGKHGFYVSSDNGINWKIVDSSFFQRRILDFDIDINGFHFLTQDVIRLINNEYKYLSYGGYVNYKNGKILKETRKYYNRERNDSVNIFGKSIISNNDRIIVVDDIFSVGGNQSSHKVIVSEDNGDTFEHRVNGLIEDLINTFCISHDTLIVAKNFIYITTDYGKTWKRNIPSQFEVYSSGIFNITLHKGHLFLSNMNGEVYRSSDLGINWTKIFENKNLTYIGLSSDDDGVYLASSIVQLTRDLGETFEVVPIKVKSNNFQFSQNDKELFLITSNKGIFKKEDFDKNWEILNDSLYNNLFLQSSIFVKDSLILTAYISNNIVSVSTNYGKSWNNSSLSSNSNLNYNVFINDNRLFCLSLSSGLNYSDDYGANWENWNLVNSVSPNIIFRKIINQKDTLLAGTNRGVMFSVDNGDKWELLTDANLINNQTIIDISKNENVIIVCSSASAIYKSEDYGKSWKVIESIENKSNNRKLINNRENFFLFSNDGFFYSKDNGENWIKYNKGLEDLRIDFFQDMVIYEEKIIVCYNRGIYSLPLSELGIEYKSVQKTETRNYLWTNPPYPQPTNGIVKVETYWDSALPFTEKDIEIYDLTGIKINTENTLSIQKESIYKGHIIWDASSYKTGIYIMKITHGTETRVRKIMVVE
jgi:photosystem II stability/assembly factor-like uncharacterized protein